MAAADLLVEAADLLVEAAEFVAAPIVKVRVYCDGGRLVGGGGGVLGRTSSY